MIINEDIEKLKGMNIEDGMLFNYRHENGALTTTYLLGITNKCENSAKEFEIALKRFHYQYPLEGEYKISWKIERIDDDNQ